MGFKCNLCTLHIYFLLLFIMHISVCMVIYSPLKALWHKISFLYHVKLILTQFSGVFKCFYKKISCRCHQLLVLYWWPFIRPLLYDSLIGICRYNLFGFCHKVWDVKLVISLLQERLRTTCAPQTGYGPPLKGSSETDDTPLIHSW